MTAPRDYRDFLGDLVEACRAIIGFVEGMTLEQYLDDRKTEFAVMRGFEMMGEAARNLPDGIKAAHPEIPWRLMTAVRNRIVHAYFGLDDTTLFTTIHDDLKPLLPKLEALALEHRTKPETA
jgi:uncharacterized protein with HEPN domain